MSTRTKPPRQLHKKHATPPRRLAKRRREQGLVVLEDVAGVAPLSRMLLDFMAPFLEEPNTEEGIRHTITVGVAAWNLANLPPAAQRDMTKALLQTLPRRERRYFSDLLEALVSRKRRLYGDVERMVLEFEVSFHQGEANLRVLSTPPPGLEA